MKDESYIEYDKYGKCHGAIFSLISVSIGLMWLEGDDIVTTL